MTATCEYLKEVLSIYIRRIYYDYIFNFDVLYTYVPILLKIKWTTSKVWMKVVWTQLIGK